jgi:hypothetical protein
MLSVALALGASGAIAFGDDSFAGNYAGTFHPLGEYGGKPKPEDSKSFKPRKCGNCHVEATVERAGRGYVLTMDVEHGKDEQGKLKKDRIRLTGERRGDTLSFVNEKYSIAVEKGKATGGRTGRMAASVELTRKPPLRAAEPPAARPSDGYGAGAPRR